MSNFSLTLAFPFQGISALFQRDISLLLCYLTRIILDWFKLFILFAREGFDFVIV